MRRLLALLPCLLLTACAYTTITTQRLPAAATQQPFSSLMVFIAGKQLGLVKEAEKSMGEELAATGVAVQFGTAHLPFDAGPDEVFAKAATLPVEGLLVVAEESMDVQTVQSPGYWVPATKDSPGYYVPETTSQMFVAKFSAHLHSLRVKDKPERVWLADIDSSAGDFGGQREIFKDIGKKVARKLVEDGMIVDNRPKK
jgi:hypothetical protein